MSVHPSHLAERQCERNGDGKQPKAVLTVSQNRPDQQEALDEDQRVADDVGPSVGRPADTEHLYGRNKSVGNEIAPRRPRLRQAR